MIARQTDDTPSGVLGVGSNACGVSILGLDCAPPLDFGFALHSPLIVSRELGVKRSEGSLYLTGKMTPR